MNALTFLKLDMNDGVRLDHLEFPKNLYKLELDTDIWNPLDFSFMSELSDSSLRELVLNAGTIGDMVCPEDLVFSGLESISMVGNTNELVTPEVQFNLSTAFPNLERFAASINVDVFPNGLDSIQTLRSIYLAFNNIEEIPENFTQNLQDIISMTLPGNPISELGSNSLFALKDPSGPISYYINLDYAMVEQFPSDLFGDRRERKYLETLSLRHNTFTNFTSQPFQELLLDAVVYARPEIAMELRIDLYNCPIHCCSAAWLYLEGIRYGTDYQAQLENFSCNFGGEEETRQIPPENEIERLRLPSIEAFELQYFQKR